MAINLVIRHDRTLHFFYGSLAALVGIGAALLLRARGIPAPPGLCGLAAGAALALGREAWNKARGGSWSWADIGWTVAGGAAASSGAAAGCAA